MQTNNIMHLKKRLVSHESMSSLKLFGENLLDKPLGPIQLKVFMATLWAFYKETPSGILDLALRLSDFWRDINPWEANAKAAHLLYAGFEEFGLQVLQGKLGPSHHQLFKFTSNFFGVTESDLCSTEYVLKAGTAMGTNSYMGYRKKSIPFGIGYHLASELTSWWEFKYFYEGIIQHKKFYKIDSENHPALTFFYVHTLVETEHLSHSENIANEFIKINASDWVEIQEGAEFYMESYKELFRSLNEIIY